MNYDRAKLESWYKNMEYLQECVDSNGVSSEYAEHKYYVELHKRIAYCESIKPKDEFVLFTLAQLYSRVNPEESTENLYRLKAMTYLIKTIEKNHKHARAWGLFGRIYLWGSLIADEDLGQEKAMEFSENAILCLKIAIKCDPKNKRYQESLKNCYYCRNLLHGIR